MASARIQGYHRCHFFKKKQSFVQNKTNLVYFIVSSVSSVDILLHWLFFRKCLCPGFFYKEKRDLEMRVFREAKQKIETNNVYFFSSFGYTM